MYLVEECTVEFWSKVVWPWVTSQWPENRMVCLFARLVISTDAMTKHVHCHKSMSTIPFRSRSESIKFGNISPRLAPPRSVWLTKQSTASSNRSSSSGSCRCRSGQGSGRGSWHHVLGDKIGAVLCHTNKQANDDCWLKFIKSDNACRPRMSFEMHFYVIV